MNILNVLSDPLTNGYWVEALDLISFASILCGIFVVICKNPIRSVLFLIGLFVNIACYLVLLGLDFLGIAYLLVYVGAVSILFLFILMLINVRISELLSDTSNSIFLAIILGILFYTCVDLIYPSGVQLYNQAISLATSQSWDGYLAVSSHITSIGNIMYTSYSIWLIITSIILLLAMVGAIVITIKWESNTSTNLQSTFAGSYSFFRQGILRFFLNLSIKKILKTIRSSIIFRSIIFIIGLVLFCLGLSYSLINTWLYVGIALYYLYSFFFSKDKPALNKLPEIILSIILSIILIILPFWMVVGFFINLCNPISIIIGVTGFLDPFLNIGDFGSSSNSAGNNSNPGSGNAGPGGGPDKNWLKTVLNPTGHNDSQDIPPKKSLPKSPAENPAVAPEKPMVKPAVAQAEKPMVKPANYSWVKSLCNNLCQDGIREGINTSSMTLAHYCDAIEIYNSHVKDLEAQGFKVKPIKVRVWSADYKIMLKSKVPFDDNIKIPLRIEGSNSTFSGQFIKPSELVDFYKKGNGDK